MTSMIMGSNPVEASEFVLGFICNCWTYFTTVRITFTCILYPQCTLNIIFIIHIMLFMFYLNSPPFLGGVRPVLWSSVHHLSNPDLILGLYADWALMSNSLQGFSSRFSVICPSAKSTSLPQSVLFHRAYWPPGCVTHAVKMKYLHLTLTHCHLI